MSVPESGPSDRAAPIRVEVLLFSVLREQTGQASLAVRLPPGTTGTGLLDHLGQAWPAVEAYRRVVRLAVNETYAPESVRLHDGDVVALITPVSGG